jgi:hypothetical protein
VEFVAAHFAPAGCVENPADAVSNWPARLQMSQRASGTMILLPDEGASDLNTRRLARA